MPIKRSLFAAFKNAFNGLGYFFFNERNGRIQANMALLAIVAAILLGISVTEWIAILLCIGAVLSLEMLNSSIEKLCDLVQKDYHPVIRIVKDIAAAAVLWNSIISAVIGAVIFIPKIIALL